MQIDRREFLGAAPALTWMMRQAAQPEPAPDWGVPVIDTHLHLRNDLDGNYAHIQGSGVARAVLRARENATAQVKAIQAKYPDRFVWTAVADITKPGAEAALTQAVKDGAAGFGELKFHVAADGPELQRMYALAADLKVSIMIHFQEVEHFTGEGVFATGYKRFESVLKAHPRTTFIGHADAFWANISADYHEQAAYPTGPVVKGGITDRWLADYPNLFGDLSANSGNNALSRDPSFTPDFLVRHQDKLVFGSDCACADGRGTGVSQANNPAASRLAGKCVARETLTLLKAAAPASVFRKLTFENAERLFAIAPSH